jgi:hypothetical protein
VQEVLRPRWPTPRRGCRPPLDDATDDRDTTRVTFQRNMVKDAPRVDANGDLASEDDSRLYDYDNRGALSAETTPQAFSPAKLNTPRAAEEKA